LKHSKDSDRVGSSPVLGKQEIAKLKAELRELLQEKIQSHFSARYLTNGEVNVAARILRGEAADTFVGEEPSVALKPLAH